MDKSSSGLEPHSSAPDAAAPRKKGKRDYQTSGVHTLKAAVRGLGARGLKVVDRRTSIGKALTAWRADLVRDLGGDTAISTQQAALVDLAVRTKLLLDSVDAWLLRQTSLVNARKRALYPVVTQRTQLADALARYLTQLGLERRKADVPDLNEYMRRKANGHA